MRLDGNLPDDRRTLVDQHVDQLMLLHDSGLPSYTVRALVLLYRIVAMQTVLGDRNDAAANRGH
jgi:hypothetical protein